MFVRKINNRWYYTINEVDQHGVRHKHEHFGGFTRAEACRAYRLAMAEQDRTGKYFEPASMTFSAFLQEWLEKYARHYLKPNTIDAYDAAIRNHIAPTFGAWKLRELTTAALQDWVLALNDQYSKSTVKSIMSCLRSSLRWAVANRRYLLINPMDNVKLPPSRTAPKKPNVFTPEAIQAIFKQFPAGRPIHMPCVLSYYTGMRLGECLALTWDNVDMAARTLRITGTSYDKKGLPKITATKTASSARTITFGSKLYAELKAQKLWQDKNRFQAGPFYREDPQHKFVCTMDDGRQMTSNNVKYFGMWCKKHFSGTSFHSFRHTHATMLIEHGLPLDYVSKRLGHSSIYTTANVYDTITDKREKAAVDAMEQFL
ncbi:MAG: tyrosine-type recombinase/integrase [Megasphaera sp.]|jgi:ATP-dependent helicase/nuclease subunit A|uniref:tyrosine-type recombinase/integrase n=1 Tax=Megasphaera sp. TaxID=2023260 RepID=UPI003F086B76